MPSAENVEPPKSNNHQAAAAVVEQGWWNFLVWIADSLFVPCKPILFFPLNLIPWWRTHIIFTMGMGSSSSHSAVIGTILSRGRAQVTTTNNNNNHQKQKQKQKQKQVMLCFQFQDDGLVILDLPIGNCELDSACRIVLECERSHSGGGPLLWASTWTVYFNGKRVGLGWKRELHDIDDVTWALESLRAVSAGVGILAAPLTPSDDGSSTTAGRWEYFRGRFQRVVGSSDSESYHLVDPAGCLGHELSFFFVRP